MMDKIHKWIITVAAVLIVIWILSKGFLFVYNLTAVVNNLTTRITNVERVIVNSQQPQQQQPAVRPTQ